MGIINHCKFKRFGDLNSLNAFFFPVIVSKIVLILVELIPIFLLIQISPYFGMFQLCMLNASAQSHGSA